MTGNFSDQPVAPRSGTPASACSMTQKPTIAPTDDRCTVSHQYATKKSEIAMTISVGAGRFAPKLANTYLNAGITQIMMTQTTTMATVMTEIG